MPTLWISVYFLPLDYSHTISTNFLRGEGGKFSSFLWFMQIRAKKVCDDYNL